MDGVVLEFSPEGIDRLADFAFQVNQTSQNIGARRLHTILERLLEEISFEAPSSHLQKVTVDVTYVDERLQEISQDDDLSKFIL